MTTELQTLLADHEEGHSDFQIDNMIGEDVDGGTAYGKYKQVLRELKGRVRNLEAMYVQADILNLDLADAEGGTGPRADLNAELVSLRIKALDENIAATEREFFRFFAQAKALKAEIGDLTDEKRAELDRQMWYNRRPDLRKKIKTKGDRFGGLKVDKTKKAKDIIKEK